MTGLPPVDPSNMEEQQMEEEKLETWPGRNVVSKKDRTDCLGPKYIIHISGCIVADNSALSTRFLPHVEPAVKGLMNTG
ncbi:MULTISPECIES: hypothetical protein [unclassified Bradyrhizobium]|uniref:hypothetical protein n=1 Tax=unclassified Bradyrhizobium TaxID=2631580 RepID=UPI001CD6B414|nr:MULTISPECIES: hypothetical protein [unclassified Bradyrhizobium]MCA1374978.1 hypothetical protein [Bradyrhizobium sp. IC4060]MCA1431741.1 hypothetical protein [Bradyrhizobium sp. BRP20]MCA1484825.1 hypothetical protein [Bradyrhizobium sp. IC4061]MCA1538435.1 hypothetical protein [Bradyrhizobium sp. NBAIM32]